MDLVLCAKWPIKGKSKTRLSASIGDDDACAFSMACLRDILRQFSIEPGFERRVILFAPEEHASSFEKLLVALDIGNKWELLPMINGSDLENPSLGAKLAQSLLEIRKTSRNSVTFIGSDCLLIQPDTFRDALDTTREDKVFISPAEDGGYVLIALPPTAPSEVFENVQWSSAGTLASQIAQIERLQFKVKVGPSHFDIDLKADFDRLFLILKGNRHLQEKNSETFAFYLKSVGP